jgi:hypothetical protein
MVWLLQTKTGDQVSSTNGPMDAKFGVSFPPKTKCAQPRLVLNGPVEPVHFTAAVRQPRTLHPVVSHALLLADVATWLMKYHMEDATTSVGFQFQSANLGVFSRAWWTQHRSSERDSAYFEDTITQKTTPRNNLVQHAGDLAFHFENLSLRSLLQ